MDNMSELVEEKKTKTPAQINAENNLKKWEEMCNIIGDFIKEYERVPSMKSNNKNEQVLGRWLFLQRSSFKKRKMHSYHVTRLREVGVHLTKL